MRTHLIPHRFVAAPEAGQTRITTRREFDVALARKMLRAGSTLSDIGAAMGMHRTSVYARLKKLGLGYLVSDRVRAGGVKSKGQLKRVAERAA